MKVVQELLRHGSSRITLDVYAQAVTPGKAEGTGKSGGDAAGHQEGRDVGLRVVCPRCVPSENRGFRQVF